VLAWLRTGLTATAVALAVGKVVPDLRSGGTSWPFVVLGAGYGLLGALIVTYGLWRGRRARADQAPGLSTILKAPSCFFWKIS
jgi:uncharacterized membrane protein YidH (DUF202 family)